MRDHCMDEIREGWPVTESHSQWEENISSYGPVTHGQLIVRGRGGGWGGTPPMPEYG